MGSSVPLDTIDDTKTVSMITLNPKHKCKPSLVIIKRFFIQSLNLAKFLIIKSLKMIKKLTSLYLNSNMETMISKLPKTLDF